MLAFPEASNSESVRIESVETNPKPWRHLARYALPGHFAAARELLVIVAVGRYSRKVVKGLVNRRKVEREWFNEHLNP